MSSASDLATLVKQAVDIVDVIGRVVPLRRTGNRHLGLCPFHQEKTPSFHVDAQNQLYYCFGCGAGGDVLRFVMKHQNLSFGEALKHLADRYHIVLPGGDHDNAPSGAAAEAARMERRQIYDVLELASDYFYRLLHHSEAGKAARDYLIERGLPAHVVETERIGYASQNWDGLLRRLKASGVDPEAGINAGLLTRSSTARDRVYDRFRNRLIFPISDDQGRIVGFGGRALSRDSQNEPKYLNSPETAVYHKGRMLYQSAKAREACRQTRQVILVEGYMDLLAFYAQGFHRVTATLGTALTPYQVRLLARMSDEVVLAYDADEAGERAMMRALPLFLNEQLPVTCLRFPEGMDPDDFLRAEGIQGFEALLRQRQDLGIYAIGKRLKDWDGSTGGKTKVLSDLRPIMEAVRQPVLKSEYLRLIADRLSVSETVISRQFYHWDRQARKHFGPPQPNVLAGMPQSHSLEESILRAMIKHPALIEDVKASGAVSFFQSPPLKAIAETLTQTPHPPLGSFVAADVYDMLPDPELKDLFTKFLLEYGDLKEAHVQIRDWLQALREQETRQTRLSMQQALRQAEQEGNTTEFRRLLAQIQDLYSARKRAKATPDND